MYTTSESTRNGTFEWEPVPAKFFVVTCSGSGSESVGEADMNYAHKRTIIVMRNATESS